MKREAPQVVLLGPEQPPSDRQELGDARDGRGGGKALAPAPGTCVRRARGGIGPSFESRFRNGGGKTGLESLPYSAELLFSDR